MVTMAFLAVSAGSTRSHVNSVGVENVGGPHVGVSKNKVHPIFADAQIALT